MLCSRCLTYLAGLMLLCAGCKAPHQMLWAPDGSAAAYRAGEYAVVIDADGQILSKLGRSSGGYAWTADSKTLYFAGATDNADLAVQPDLRWSGQSEYNVAADSKWPRYVQLCTWAGRKVTPLVKFPAAPVTRVLLSPDENWLVMTTGLESPQLAMYAYDLSAKRLYLLSQSNTLAMCFTGKNRLAFIEDDAVVEVALRSDTEKLQRTRLLDVIAGHTPWLVAVDDGLLLTAQPRTFPSTPADKDDPYKLFMFTRANGGVFAIADDVGPLFALSPDGARVLIEKITRQKEKAPEKRELVLIRANGSDGQILRELDENPVPMWPAWRGDKEIAFIAPEPQNGAVGGEPRLLFDVVLYALPEQGGLAPVRTLSDKWDPDLKPWKQPPTTRPAP